jgi:hypothetical protein
MRTNLIAWSEKGVERGLERGSELGEDFGTGAFFLADDLLDCEPAASATVPGRAVAADLAGGPSAALSDERTDVAVGGTGTVANDHDLRVAPVIMKFNVKLVRED